MAKTVRSQRVPTQTVNIGQIPVSNPDNLRPVYSNNAAVVFGPADFRLIFTEIVLGGPAAVPTLDLRANVAMAPTQFKALQHAITVTLNSYEKQFGEIKWFPEEQAKLKK